jgi:hypothetical protein
LRVFAALFRRRKFARSASANRSSLDFLGALEDDVVPCTGGVGLCGDFPGFAFGSFSLMRFLFTLNNAACLAILPRPAKPDTAGYLNERVVSAITITKRVPDIPKYQ